MVSVSSFHFQIFCFRVRRESGSLVSNLTGIVDQRCSELVNEGNRLCTDVMGQINSRFNILTDEVTIEVKKQCDSTKVVSDNE